MKKVLFAISIILFVITACKDNDKPSQKDDTSKINTDTAKIIPADTTKIPGVTHSFNNVNPRLAPSVKAIVDHYLHIKNALVNNSGSEAAAGGKEMAAVINTIDKSLLTADQKKVYGDIEDDLKENAEHISKNSGDIEHQREHFTMMSEEVYYLVKTFGGGQVLYLDHCPMANDNKGAMWLSETKEVKNPYFGGKMNECVKVSGVIK